MVLVEPNYDGHQHLIIINMQVHFFSVEGVCSLSQVLKGIYDSSHMMHSSANTFFLSLTISFSLPPCNLLKSLSVFLPGCSTNLQERIWKARTLIFNCVCSFTQSRLILCDPIDYSPPGSSVHQAPHLVHFPGKNIGVDCHSLLQGVFLTQGSNPSLLHLLHWQADISPLHRLGSPGFNYGQMFPRDILAWCIMEAQKR